MQPQKGNIGGSEGSGGGGLKTKKRRKKALLPSSFRATTIAPGQVKCSIVDVVVHFVWCVQGIHGRHSVVSVLSHGHTERKRT